MKILHINSYYAAGTFYKPLYERQQEEGLAVAVYVPVPYSARAPVQDLGPYTTLSANHGRYDRLFFHLKHGKIYRDLVKRYRPDQFALSHAHSLFSNGYLALKLKEDYGLPYLVAVRNTDLNTFFKYMVHLRGLGRRILGEAEKIVFLSRPYRDRLLARYIPPAQREALYRKAVIIPNGIDDFWLRNRPSGIKKVDPESIRIFFAGRITPGKNISTTLRACRLLQDRGYRVRFTVAGRIKSQAEYRALQAHDFVTYVGYLPREELLHYYRQSDLFVMPSRTETFGRVYAEAMSQGLPVIYTRGQGFDGQFKDGEVGYPVESHSAGEIADRVEDIWANYEQLSKNCLDRAGQFNWSRIAEEYSRLYSRMR